MKNWLKIHKFGLRLLLIASIIVLLGYNVFHVSERRYECSGKMTYQEVTTISTIYIKITIYGLITHLWGDSVGSVNLEIPNEWFDYYDRVDLAGDNLLINKSGASSQPMSGVFSELSNSLNIATANGDFKGICKILN